MVKKGELKEILKHFSKNQLDRICNQLKIEVAGHSRDEIINIICTIKNKEIEFLGNAYQKLDGVSVNVLIKEIFLYDKDIGKLVENDDKKNQIVTDLFLSGHLGVIDIVADYARFEKKKKMSPLFFDGQLKDEVDEQELVNLLGTLISKLNDGRPNKIYLDNASLIKDDNKVIILLSREIGKRHIRQRPNRSPSAEMIEHDDYPLNTYSIELDFRSHEVKSTFRENELDGIGIIKAIIDQISTKESILKEADFLCNPLDLNHSQIVNERIELAQSKISRESDIFQTLDLVKNAKKTGLTIKGLNLEGDLQKMEIKAGEIEKILKSLNIDNNMLLGAKSTDYEIELQDESKRKIKVIKSSLTFSGKFSDEEKKVIRDILKGP